MKKILPFFLIVLMSMTGTKTFAHDIAVENANGVTIYYNWINNKTELAVTYKTDENGPVWPSYRSSVVIPSEVTYNGHTYSVTRIGDTAFALCESMYSVTIPNSVTSIGSCAFEGCDIGISEIIIGKNVKSIGSSAFSGCHYIGNVISMSEDPSSILLDMFDYFYSCDNVKLIVPKGTKAKYESIYGRLINNIIEYDKKKSIHVSTAGTLPNLLQYYDKITLEELTLTGNLNGTDIGCIRRMAGAPVNYYDVSYGSDGAYKEEAGKVFGNLAVLDISGAKIVSGGDSYYNEWVRKWEEDGDYRCVSDNSTTNNTISLCMFKDCKLTKVSLPTNVTSIGRSAFSGCSGLTSITIPNSVTNIGGYAFSGCNGLTSIVSKIKNPFTIDNNVFGSNIFSSATLIVPYGTKFIYQSTAGWNQFQNIVEVDPKGERVIYEKDFTGISEFTGWSQFDDSQTDGKVGVDPNGVAITVGVQIGEVWQPQVMIIPDGSFNLEKDGNYRVVITAKFPTDGILQINMGSWSANDQNQFPVKSTGDFQEIVCDFDGWSVDATDAHLLFQCGDFKGTTIVKKIQVIDMGDTVIPFSVDNVCYNLFTKDKTAKVTSKPQKYQGNVTIPSTIIYKGEEYAVTAIDKYAFYNCSGLTSVTIPNSVTSIGFCAFRECSGLTSITIPNSVTYIGSYTFSGCNNLQFACISSEKFPISTYSLGNTSCQFIVPQSAFDGGIPSDITNYATYSVTPKFIEVTSTTATTATLKLTPIDIASGKTNGKTTYEAKVYNLKPGTAIKGSWELEDKDRGVVSIPTVYAKSLVMTVQPAIPLSEVKARLSATINEPDDDKHYGFEWLRSEAPDNMTPYQVPAQLYNGKIVGSLSNLKSEIFYKYRPFYKADDGTIIRGNWEAFNTGDANVLYEPEVYTKEATISSKGPTISGVFTEGPDDVIDYGFEYGQNNSSARAVGLTRGDGLIKVVLSGNNTSATIEGLEPGTEYVYRAYMTTASGTIYGEYKTFKTPLPGDANNDGKVDVADIVEVVNAKAGKASASFSRTNADVDGNGSITEAEIVKVIMQK